MSKDSRKDIQIHNIKDFEFLEMFDTKTTITQAEPRTVPRHKDPSNANREPQRHARDTITHT
jgi:hypothetical protein